MSPEFKEHGYDKEEEYFYKRNRELMQNMRQKLDADRAKQESRGSKEAHWLKCPKCGGSMSEVALHNIKIDQCGSCSGIYFDKGELELLLDAQEPQGFVKSLKRMFHRD